ncbi:MAG: assimilatory sulfite reductase (NADPH) hemoprotein subunit [Proteobacteria bacterium]|nr:assimilatory sulfite reductase (NADPH) hemoprotein subunit [Pseudomonadota bacterium]MDA1352317.1 assimilatory sulfite reductase (NADPH) hemoprotein subunit [Pseudomonadota bacterium]
MSDTKISPTQYDAVTHTDVERIKVQSDYLRGSIKDGLIDPITGSICDDDQVLIKFHGIYQQDDRDLRNDRRKAKLEPLYAFMIRARVPGGVASSGQYQVLAELAKKYSNGSLRLTTRQAFQWHGVFKRNLKRTIAGINSTLLDTVAACGDVNRNVMATSLPETSEIHQEVYQWAKKLSEHLLPKSNAFHEIWLDGEKVESTEEPIYGKTYLPRKFKTAIAIPPNNDVDVYANDLGFIAIIDQQKLIGFNVLVGGGMGTAHNDSQTYPRVADVIGFCTPDKLLEVAESVVRLQRDYGDRKVRKLARLKYTIDRLGIDQFKSILSDYLGWSLAGAKSFEFSGNGDRYGWLKTENDKWHLTLYIHSGRIVDSPQTTLFSGLLAIADIHQGEFRITGNQNLIISNITPETKQHIQSLISQHGISFGSVETPVRLNSVACVAFPTCSLAMAEAERYLPDLISKIEVILDQYNLLDQPINIRMTGCPNGCARPFLGEIGFVGKAPGKYNLYLGASFKGDRLNKLYKENINEQQILDELNLLFKDYADQRSKGEFFGDFVIRKGYIRPVVNGLDFHG